MLKENGVLLDVSEEDIYLLDENPDNFWDGVDSIGPYAFTNSNVKNIVIPSHITQIGGYGFWGCINLENVIFDCNSKLTVIDEHAFETCHKLKSINVPDGVTIIGAFAFCDCQELRHIHWPISTSKIQEFTFEHCLSLDSIDADFVTDIEYGAFKGCNSLRCVNLKSINNIGMHAFYGCYDLEDVNLGSQIKRLGDFAFAECPSLKGFNVPKSIRYIAPNVFAKREKEVVVENNHEVRWL